MLGSTAYPQYKTTTEDTFLPVADRFEMYLVPVLFALIFVSGVLGNGIIILILARHREMRNVPNIYILNLALGDLLLILISVPFASTIYTFDSWPFGPTICKISEMAKDMSVGVSVFTLTALSIERYLAISNPIKRRIPSRSSTILIIAAIWLVATMLAVPSALFSHMRTVTLLGGYEMEYCSPFPEKLGDLYRQGVVVFKFLVYYSVPLCIIACFYGLMAKHLNMTAHNVPGEWKGQLAQIRSRKKVAKIVISFIIIFIICFLPHHIFMLWFHLSPTSHANFGQGWNNFRILAFCFSFSNSCINPIALYIISKVFRNYFNRYLGSEWRSS